VWFLCCIPELLVFLCIIRSVKNAALQMLYIVFEHLNTL